MPFHGSKPPSLRNGSRSRFEPSPATKVLQSLAQARLQALERSRGSLDLEKALLDSCFPAQRAFVEDMSPFLVGFCTRRAAKSWGDTVKLLLSALRHPNSANLYLTLTRESGSGAIWDEILKPLNEQFRIGIEFNEAKLVARLPNNSRIHLVGVDQEGEARKLLGRAPPLVVIDEAQDIRADIRRLVFETLKPAMAQHRLDKYPGQLVMSGTPSHAALGYFYEVTSGRHPDSALWAKRTWSWRDNPHVAAAIQADIDATVAALGPAYLESPEYLRQFEGRWILYSDELCYHYSDAKNALCGPPPEGEYTSILAGDLGWTDASALTVVRYSEHDPHLYIVYSEKRAGLDFTAFAEWAHEIQERYQCDLEIIDGANKQGVAELNARHGHAFVPADKNDKATHMKLFDSDLANGRIKVDPVACRPLLEEWSSLIWEPKAKLKGVLVEDPRCQNHVSDSTLYGWRAAYNYLSEPLPEVPEPGTPEHANWRAHQDDLESIRQAQQESRRNQALYGILRR
jgi:hypothetical protein